VKLLHLTRQLHLLVLVEHNGGVVSERRQRSSAESPMATARRGAKRLDIILSRLFSCHARNEDLVEASPHRQQLRI